MRRVRMVTHILYIPRSPPLEFWTATNVANGLNALATCVEVRWYFRAEVIPSENLSDGLLLLFHAVGISLQGVFAQRPRENVYLASSLGLDQFLRFRLRNLDVLAIFLRLHAR